MHTCPLYTYTNNTSVKLNKTLRARNESIERERGTGPLNMRIYTLVGHKDNLLTVSSSMVQ